MGSAAASSKPKKNSGEDRRKRKNPKPRKRRRVSSSPSSYSSDPDDIPRRRRSSRRKPEKRRGRDPKRSSKKKLRKARDRSLSSSSRDSGSSSDRSRSPVRRRRDDRKGKLKKVKRVNKLDGAVRSSRSRNRSLSCSACSGRDSRSNSPLRMHSYRVDKNKEMDGSKQIGSSSVIESRGDVEKMHGGREMDSELNVANYGGLPRADAALDVVRAEQAWVMDSSSHGRGSELDRWMGERNIGNDLYFDRFEDSGTPTSELYKKLDVDSDYSRRIRSEIVAADKHESESDDLELMLRQKALENLNKLRGALSSVNKATNDKEKVSIKESSEKPCGTSTDSIISKQRQIQAGIPLDVSNVNPINKLPPMKPNYSTFENKPLFSCLNESRNSIQLECSMSSQSTSNPLSIIENSPEKLSYRQSPCRGSLEKNASAGCASGNSLGAELNLNDGLASGNTCLNEKEKVSETNEIVKECQSGSQFEKKTFSRTHDGEVVQVMTSALAPRKPEITYGAVSPSSEQKDRRMIGCACNGGEPRPEEDSK